MPRADTARSRVEQGTLGSDTESVELQGLEAHLAQLDRQAADLADEKTRAEAASRAAAQKVEVISTALVIAEAKARERSLRGSYALGLLLSMKEDQQREQEVSLLDQLRQETPGAPSRALACLEALAIADRERGPAKALTFVAMNDPDDLLGYSIPKKLQERTGMRFANVRLRLTHEYARLFALPGPAHTNHDRSERALRLISCGARASAGNQVVPVDCSARKPTLVLNGRPGG